MLSRTASDLYWMSRYLERAENLARMLEVSYSLSLMPQAGRSDGHAELAMSLLASGTLDDYIRRHTELDTERMLHFFALDATNPSSIYCCLQAARTNAHAVRGRITADMWENINATWIEMRNIASNGLGRYGISQFCDWVKMAYNASAAAFSVFHNRVASREQKTVGHRSAEEMAHNASAAAFSVFHNRVTSR